MLDIVCFILFPYLCYKRAKESGASSPALFVIMSLGFIFTGFIVSIFIGFLYLVRHGDISYVIFIPIYFLCILTPAILSYLLTKRITKKYAQIPATLAEYSQAVSGKSVTPFSDTSSVGWMCPGCQQTVEGHLDYCPFCGTTFDDETQVTADV